MSTGTIRIDRPFDELEELLSFRPADWLLPFVRIAAYTGEAAAGRSIHVPSPPGHRQISVELSTPANVEDHREITVPIRMRTSGFDWVPPAYAGRLILQKVSNHESDLTLEGSYALPSTASEERHAHASEVATQVTVLTLLRSFRVAVEEQARQTG